MIRYFSSRAMHWDAMTDAGTNILVELNGRNYGVLSTNLNKVKYTLKYYFLLES